MLFNLSNTKLRIVVCDYYRRQGNSRNGSYYSNNISNTCLADMIVVYDINGSKKHIGDDCYYTSPFCAEKVFGMYLGDNDSIETIISSKTLTSLTGVKRVYFDPKSKYPRFKLSEATTIKRSLTAAKADVCILPKVQYDTYKPQYSSGGAPRDKNIKLYYSPSEDTYYLIDHKPGACYQSSSSKDLNNFINKAINTSSSDPLEQFASAVMAEGIIPADCTLFYSGKCCFFTDNSEYEQVNNILNNYMKIIYDTELDKFVSNNLSDLTEDDLKSLSGMLGSQDPTVVGMGIKLLSGYNILDSACSVGILLMSNWNTITSNSAFKSVGFQQILNTLGISEREIYSGITDNIINKLYKSSTNDADKEKARKIVIDKLKKSFEKKWAEHKSQLDAIPMNFDFTLE